MRHRWPALLAVVSVSGCDGASETEVSPPPLESECLAPNRVVGERCIEPGVQDDGCPAGTLALSDGSCQPAGVPPDACAEGFAPGDNMGCEPILPPAPCGPGELAIPGERACHSMMPCGSGKWGDIPIDGATIHVDAGYTGGTSDGTAAQPWTTIGDAIANADSDALIAVAAGRYVEDVFVDKRVRLFGVCPDLVELAGTSAAIAALMLPAASSGSEVRGLAVTGDSVGIVARQTSVLVEHVWVHDALGKGVSVEDVVSMALNRSLIEQNHEAGVVVYRSQATLDGVVVRDTAPRADNRMGRGVSIESGGATDLMRSVIAGNHELGVLVTGSVAKLAGVVVRGTLPDAADQQRGWGIGIQTGPEGSSDVDIAGALIEANHELGLYVSGSTTTLDAVVVRGTQPRASDQQLGLGIAVQDNLGTGLAAKVAIARSVFGENHAGGVFLAGAETTLEGVVVRGTQPRGGDQKFGRGIGVELDATSIVPPSAVVRGTVVEQNHDVGVFVSGAGAMLDGLVVRTTQPQASDQQGGYGLAIQRDVSVETTAILKGSRIEENHDAGVLVIGAQVTVEGVVVRGTLPRAADQRFGRGINVQYDLDTAVRATGLVRASLVEDNRDVGVFVGGSQTTLENLLVRGTMVRASDGLYGDGIAVTSTIAVAADAAVFRSRVEGNARSGVANFGAHVVLDESKLSCNAIDLDGESAMMLAFSFDDRGGNSCGCPEPTGACVAQSSGLAPPDDPR